MKRKIFVVLLTLFLLINFVPVKASDNILHLDGTISTKCQELALTEFYLGGENIGEFSGTITYDKTKLAFMKGIVASKYSTWDIVFDNSTPGVIKIKASRLEEGAVLINSEEKIFTIMFVAHTTSVTSTVVNAKGFTGFSIEQIRQITNQEEIDQKTQEREDIIVENGHKKPTDFGYVDPDSIVIPEPIYSEEIQENKTLVTFPNHSQTIKTEKNKVSDSYLRKIEINNSTFEPTFSRGVYAYKVTVDSKQEIVINCEAEDVDAKVTIEDEVNNQIIINVKAEDGTTSTYVLTIVRQDNYNSSGKNNNTGGSTNVDPVVNPTVVIEDNLLSTKNIIIYSGLGIIAIIGFVFGGIFISKGAEEEYVD